jgi:hypothetical protein
MMLNAKDVKTELIHQSRFIDVVDGSKMLLLLTASSDCLILVSEILQ